jgi:transposase-like protein
VSPQPASCPHCGSTDVELIGGWGGQLITSQMRCRRCNSYFEAVRDTFARPETPAKVPNQQPTPPGR